MRGADFQREADAAGDAVAILETAGLHRSECDRLAMCGCAPGECAYRAELAERRAARAVWLAAVYAQGAVQSVLDNASLTVTEPTLILYGVIDRIRLVTGGHAETEARRRLAEIAADIREAIGLWNVWPERLPRIIAALEDVAVACEWARP
jgi:hypothetical protein